MQPDRCHKNACTDDAAAEVGDLTYAANLSCLSLNPSPWHDPASAPLKLGFKNISKAFVFTRAVPLPAVFSDVVKSCVSRQSVQTFPATDHTVSACAPTRPACEEPSARG